MSKKQEKNRKNPIDPPVSDPPVPNRAHTEMSRSCPPQDREKKAKKT